MPDEGSAWSPLLYRTEGAVTYAVWKKPWKGGLNAYKSTTTIRGVSADELYRYKAALAGPSRLERALMCIIHHDAVSREGWFGEELTQTHPVHERTEQSSLILRHPPYT
jgi:hypothetical protein